MSDLKIDPKATEELSKALIAHAEMEEKVIQQRIDTAVKAEMERCAKVAGLEWRSRALLVAAIRKEK